jgi:hypothetical protein
MTKAHVERERGKPERDKADASKQHAGVLP